MTEVATIIEQYTAAKEQMQQLKIQIYDVFKGLQTLDEKLRFVLDHGTEFLKYESYYCGPQSRSISLYDSLYWERYETKSLDDIIEYVVEDLDCDEDENENIAETTETSTFHPLAKDEEEAVLFKAILEGKTARVVVIRDLLSQGIGSARFDW